MRANLSILKLRNLLLILTVVSLLTAGECPATNGPPRIDLETGRTQKVELSVGKSVIIESPDLAKRVSIAAPEIADALVLTPHQIYITGKAPGVTNLTIWTGNGTAVSAVFNIDVMPDITRLKEKIHELLPHEREYPSDSNVRIYLSFGDSFQRVKSYPGHHAGTGLCPPGQERCSKSRELAGSGGVHQVMLEVRVSEMSRSLIKKLGFNFNFVSQSGQQFGASLLGNLTSLPTTGAFPSSPIGVSNNANLLFQFLGAGATWTFAIDALKDEGLLKVLAKPTLITLSGKQADFLAGGEFPVPIPQPSAGGAIITIEYKPYGVALKFTPTVLSSGRINMQIAPEVSELDFSNAVQLQGYLVPALTTRRVSTVIEMADGQSFAIAGLLHDEVRGHTKSPSARRHSDSGGPLQKQPIPEKQYEIVIIVTAHLVKPLDTAKQTVPTDQFIEPDDFEFYLLGDLEGRRKEKPAATGSSQGLQWGIKSAGLEGDFGHIMP